MQPQTGSAMVAPQDQPPRIAEISRLLVQEILHLRETLSFYELHLAAHERGASQPGRLSACGDAQCPALQMHFDFCRSAFVA